MGHLNSRRCYCPSERVVDGHESLRLMTTSYSVARNKWHFAQIDWVQRRDYNVPFAS